MNTKRERGKQTDDNIGTFGNRNRIVYSILFAPEQSNTVLSQIRFFFGDTFGTYYLVIGLGIFILSCILLVLSMVTSSLESRMKSQNILSLHGVQ